MSRITSSSASKPIAKMEGLLNFAETVASQHLARTEESDRKARGQFFTPLQVAQFMAGLFVQTPLHCRVLDAGAGVGTLTAAIIERLVSEEQTSSIDIVAYETDPTTVNSLEQTLARCADNVRKTECKFSSEVRITDFISDVACSNRFLFADNSSKFDLVIMNPPYFKLRRNSEYSSLAKVIGPNQPNIYSLFMAAAIECIVPGGELVAITPRSFCNGLYFREFRNWLMKRADLIHIHAFNSRSDTFRESSVLQENIITHFRRRENTTKSSSQVTVSRSIGRDLNNLSSDILTKSRVIDNSCGDNLICIPETSLDVKILELTEKWSGRFSDTDLRISTGPVVMYRTRQFHENIVTDLNVPLLTSHHIRNGRVTWPRRKKKWPMAFSSVSDSKKHLLPTANYVLLKRFSAKEERRRLSAGVLNADDFSTSNLAVENHVNYIFHSRRGLKLEEALGLTALFNSALLDRYFRTFSGNTQVNATEIRTMKFPNLELITRIGCELLSDESAKSEEVVMSTLGVQGSIRTYIEGYTR